MNIKDFGSSISPTTCYRLLKGGTITGGPSKPPEDPELEKIIYKLFFNIGIIAATTYLLYSFLK